jgi:hypothetical protein
MATREGVQRQVEADNLEALDVGRMHREPVAPITQVIENAKKLLGNRRVGKRSRQLDHVPSHQINKMRNHQCLCGYVRFAVHCIRGSRLRRRALLQVQPPTNFTTGTRCAFTNRGLDRSEKQSATAQKYPNSCALVCERATRIARIAGPTKSVSIQIESAATWWMCW